MSEKKVVDWELIEKLFRAGVMTLREIGSEHGVSHTAIQKRAKKEAWTRDLSKRIQERAKELVNRQEVANSGNAGNVTEKVVEAVIAKKVADIDLADRQDLQDGIDIIRVLTRELAALSRPEFVDSLNKLGEDNDKTYTTETGRVVKDKDYETYMYIISIAGRIKMLKDLAGAVGVYTPLRRKVVGLDTEAAKSDVDDLLLKIAREKGAA